MRTSGIIFFLSLIIILTGLASALPAILNAFPAKPRGFQNIYGNEIEIYGSGIYKNDSVFSALGFLAQDIVMLIFGVPILILLLLLYVNRKVKAAGPALMSIMGFFLYSFLSLSFGASYNQFFLLYVLGLSASFYILILLAREVQLPVAWVKQLPNKFPGIYLIISGVLTLIIWGIPLLDAAVGDRVPHLLFHNTTLVTHALDLAIIVPASIVGGILILKKHPIGYKIAFPLLGIIIFLLPVILLSTYLQYDHGMIFNPAEIAGPISGFLILGILGIWILVRILFSFQKNKLNSL
ncbi:MAG TPA: hypothetical protein VK941_11320 [Gillisia sp.]|nr:hypothetical protein [Gillisia sp.]